jgi:hypothetical protein
LACASFAGSASAITINLTGSIGSNLASGNDGDVVYRSAAIGDVRFIASPNGSDLTWSSGNGLGIDCPRSINGCRTDSVTQIDAPEVLTVRFERSVFLSSIQLSQLTTTGRHFLRTDERGSITGSGFDIDFDSDDANRDGFLTVNVNRWVTSIRLVPDNGEVNDFSLARLRIDETRVPPAPGGGSTNPIPEPSSVLMMLVGGGIVATQVRGRLA